MTNATRRIAELTAAGLEVYPAGTNLRGMGAAAPRKGVADRRTTKPEAVAKFLQWIKGSHPRLFAAASKQIDEGGGLGQTATTQPSVFDRIMGTIQTLAPVYLQTRAQRELLNVQLDRARNNLPPLDMTQYAPTVQLSVDPAAVDTVKPWLIYGAIAAAGLFLFSQLRGRR